MAKRAKTGAADDLVKQNLTDASKEPKRPVSTHESGCGMLKYTGPPLKKRLIDVDVADLMRKMGKPGDRR